MKILSYEINNTVLATVGAIILLIVLALTVWPWFWLPALVIIGLVVGGLFWASKIDS
jgi:hypothetical protein